MKFKVDKLWNGEQGRGTYEFEISRGGEFTNVSVRADFYNDPAPTGQKGYLMAMVF